MDEITTVDELPEKFQGLAEEIGVENVLRLMEHFEGEEVYVNKLQDSFRSFWQSRMKEEHRVRKFTLPQLAHRYGVSERHVRRIVDDPRQISMFKSEP